MSPASHRTRLCAVLLLVLAPWTRLAATDWYMAPTPQGNDGNPGTLAQPFNTFWEAGTHAQPGDTVYLMGGTYALNSPAWIPCTGSAGALITFEPYPGETPVIDATGLTSTTADIGIGGSYVAVSGLTVLGGGGTGISGWGFSHLQITGNTVSGTASSGIYVGYGSLGTVTDILISGNTVHDCVQTNNPPCVGACPAGWPATVSTYWVTSATVSANLVYDSYGEGVAITHCDDVLVSHNTVHDDYASGFYLDNVQDSTVTANLAYTTDNPAYYRFSVPCIAISAANENFTTPNPLNSCLISDNVTVGGHYGFYYGNYENGGGLKNFTVAHNTFYGASDQVLWIDPDPGHVGNLFADNLFVQTGSGGVAYFGGPASGFTFTDNGWWPASPGGTLASPGDVLAEPLFAAPGGLVDTDYRLLPGSPGLASGIAVAGVPADRTGTAFPVPADLGAYQLIESPTSTPTATPTELVPSPTPTPTGQAGPRTARVFPNPFHPQDGQVLHIDQVSAGTVVTIFDLLGRKVYGFTAQGNPAVDVWNGLNENGARVVTGVYLLAVRQGGGSAQLLRVAVLE